MNFFVIALCDGVFSFLPLSCPGKILAYYVLLSPVLSCPVLSCPVLPCPFLSCPVLSCLSACLSLKTKSLNQFLLFIRTLFGDDLFFLSFFFFSYFYWSFLYFFIESLLIFLFLPVHSFPYRFFVSLFCFTLSTAWSQPCHYLYSSDRELALRFNNWTTHEILIIETENIWKARAVLNKFKQQYISHCDQSFFSGSDNCITS